MVIFVLFFLLISLVLFSVFLYFHKSKYYSYSIDNDYRYDMREKCYSLSLQNNRIVLPDEIGISDTVFCKVRIKANLFGNLLAPYLKLNNREDSKQYYEVGVNGYRYVNLSNRFGEDKVIKFITNKCTISNETVEVYAYKNQDISISKILIIAPHPDDAEISSYGLYSDNSENTFILTITGGENGNDSYNVFNSKKKNDFARMKLRTWNSVTVPMLAGVSTDKMVNLGYADGSLKTMYENKNETFVLKEEQKKILKTMNVTDYYSDEKRSWQTLKSDIEKIINDVKPDIIIAPHPYLDAHTDHIYSTKAVTETLRDMNYKDGNLFLYTIHNTISPYYPFGKMESMMTLPPLFDQAFCFERIYNFNLDKEQIATKILAFEAMNDLRIGLDILNVKKVFRRVIKMVKHSTLDIEKDYYNRFIRSNELFYIIPFDKLDKIFFKK